MQSLGLKLDIYYM